jgi:hypothetical protein
MICGCRDSVEPRVENVYTAESEINTLRDVKLDSSA